jgi:hypothetical protein
MGFFSNNHPAVSHAISIAKETYAKLKAAVPAPEDPIAGEIWYGVTNSFKEGGILKVKRDRNGLYYFTDQGKKSWAYNYQGAILAKNARIGKFQKETL